MKEVTDPDLLKQLEASPGKEVTDPGLLAQLNAPEPKPGVISRAASNIIPSTLEVGKREIATLTSPKTYEGLGDLSRLSRPEGWISLYAEGKDPWEMMKGLGPGIVKPFVEKYGSWEKAKETLAEKPAEVLYDISSMVGLLPGKIGAAGRVLEPINLAVAAPKAALKLMPESKRLDWYASSLKGLTGKKVSWEDKQEILRKGIEKGILHNEAGLNRLRGKIDAATEAFDNAVAESSKTGAMIKSKDVIKYLDEVEDFFHDMPSNKADLADIAKIRNDFLADHGIEIGAKSVMTKVPTQVNTGLLDQNGKPIFKTVLKDKIKNIPGEMEIPVEEAMRIKRAAYAKYKDAYGQLSSAAKEANKNIARGVKEEFINMHPELRALGQDERVMIKLEEAIEAGMKRSQNYDKGRFPSLIAGGAAGTISESGKIGVAVYMAKSLLDNPGVKSALAIALDRASKIPFSPKTTTRLRQGLYQGQGVLGGLSNQLEE